MPSDNKMECQEMRRTSEGKYIRHKAHSRIKEVRRSFVMASWFKSIKPAAVPANSRCIGARANRVTPKPTLEVRTGPTAKSETKLRYTTQRSMTTRLWRPSVNLRSDRRLLTSVPLPFSHLILNAIQCGINGFSRNKQRP